MTNLNLASSLRNLLRQEQPGWIGIDVGSAMVKVAQVEKRNGSFVVSGSAIFENPHAADWTAETHDLNWIRRGIQENFLAFQSHGGAPAACVLTPSAAEIRTLELPSGTDEELRLMAEEELKASFPARAEDLQFDFWESPVPGGGEANGTTPVSALVTSRMLAERIAAEVAAAGLDCQVLDGQPWTATRAAQLANPGKASSHSVAVLDWGHASAQLTVARGGKPIFTRELRDCGLNGVVTAISQGLNIDASDVPHLLTTYGLPAENGGNSEQQRLRQLLGDMISDPMKKLVDELTKTTQYLKLQWGDHAPEQLLLIGGGGAICNVDSYLAESLELPVACWRLPGAANSAASPGEPPQQILANAIALSTLAWQS